MNRVSRLSLVCGEEDTAVSCRGMGQGEGERLRNTRVGVTQNRIDEERMLGRETLANK